MGTIFSSKLEVNKKLDILKNEFDLPLEDDIGKYVNNMCNLSQGIREEAYDEGISEGKVLSIIELLKLFGVNIPAEIMERLYSEKDDAVLMEWLKNAARVGSLAEFIQNM